VQEAGGCTHTPTAGCRMCPMDINSEFMNTKQGYVKDLGCYDDFCNDVASAMLHLTKAVSFLARCRTCDAYRIFCHTLQLYCIPDDELTHGGSPAAGQTGGQLGFFTSTGHSAAVPVQDSRMSQTPAAALQTAAGPL